MESVANGVESLHTKGVMHFDIKSQNIFVNVKQGDIEDVVIADFGIASTSFVDHHCGTPGVGSPEQFTSSAVKESDVFSLGKVFVQIIFPWDTFWGIMGTPVDQSAIEKFRKTHKVLQKFHDLISSMLEVEH